jgi:hypothetical protein
MKSFVNPFIKSVLLLLLALATTVSAANAQGEPSRLRLDRLNQLEEKADEVIEVNVDGKLLDLAKRVLLKVKDRDAATVAKAITDLKGIYVKICNFSNENAYAPSDFDEIRSQLQAPGWERMAGVRSKKKKQNIEVFTLFVGEKLSGVAVIISDSKTLGVVNVVGAIDIELLVELSGRFNIPKIDIDIEKEKPELKDKTKDKPEDKDESRIVIKTEIKDKIEIKKP